MARKKKTDKEINELNKKRRKRTENPFLKYLYQHLKDKDIKASQLLKQINQSDGTLFAQGLFPENEENQKPFPRAVIRKLYLACHIDPARFLLDETVEKSWFDKHPDEDKDSYFTREYWETIKPHKPFISLLDFKFYETHDKIKNEDLRKAYKKIAPIFEGAKQSIEVFELLFKGDNANPGYFIAYK